MVQPFNQVRQERIDVTAPDHCGPIGRRLCGSGQVVTFRGHGVAHATARVGEDERSGGVGCAARNGRPKKRPLTSGGEAGLDSCYTLDQHAEALACVVGQKVNAGV